MPSFTGEAPARASMTTGGSGGGGGRREGGEEREKRGKGRRREREKRGEDHIIHVQRRWYLYDYMHS